MPMSVRYGEHLPVEGGDARPTVAPTKRRFMSDGFQTYPPKGVEVRIQSWNALMKLEPEVIAYR